MTSYSASWNNVPNNEDAYSVERATSSDFSDAQEIDTTAADETAYVDRDVEVGQTYWYRVRASRANVNSGYSNAASATPLKSTVNIYATKSQTAEGGTEKGQFTIYRDGGDLTRALVVQLEVETGAGRATAGDDYDALPTFVTIPAGQKQVTLDVTAKTDEEVEDPELVLLAAKDSAAYAKGPHASDGVQVLDKRQYLIAFSGMGGDAWDGHAGSTWGNLWVGYIVGQTEKSDLFRDHNEISTVERSFFGMIDADHNQRISKAEGESAEIQVVGYSKGGISAAVFTRDLFKDNERVQGYRLESKIAVKALVTMDPAEPGYNFSGPDVRSNVENFYNYFEHRARTGMMHVEQDGNIVDVPYAFAILGSPITGNHLDSEAQNSTQVQIDTTWAQSEVRHLYDLDAPLEAYMNGSEINHDTVPWYVAIDVRQNLGLPYDDIL